MPVWTLSTLLSYTPIHAPELEFYYLPFSAKEQRDLVYRCKDFVYLKDLMAEIFQHRLVFFEVNAEHSEVSHVLWPVRVEDQERLVKAFPKSLVTEIGAAISGFPRKKGEDADTFIARVVEGLQNSARGVK